MSDRTVKEYENIQAICKQEFCQKIQDYGSNWRHSRISSLTDQLFIKVRRVINIEEKKIQKIDDSIDSEFTAMVNYGIIACIQYHADETLEHTLTLEESVRLYDKYFMIAKQLMLKKNHDYGEAWRALRLSTFTDLILLKILRIRQLENNKSKGISVRSESPYANYLDIINYAVFVKILKIA